MAIDPKILKTLEDDLTNLDNIIDDISKNIVNNMNKSLAVTSEQTKNLVSEFEKGNDITKKLEASLKKAQKENRSLGLDQNRIQAQLIKAEEKLARNYSTKNKQLVETLKIQAKDNLLQQELNESVIEYLRKLEKINEEQVKANNKYKDIDKSIKSTVERHLGWVAILKAILDTALRYNAISVEIGKNTGYGADQANRVASSFVSIAQSSRNANVTLKALGAAMNDLNTATGGVAEYSSNALTTQIMLTKQFGLTGEEAAGIYKFATLTGKSSAQINDEMVGAFASTRNMVKGSANFKTTIAEAAKVSGQLSANFKNNPALITAAVVQAQALGTTLEQTKNQAHALLNFESSLESELEAELLTGQQMNLERARAAALMGDQVTVMKELNNQGMTLEKFQNMNVLAQESFAKALGLSADALSDQLRKQKIAQEQGKSLAQITKEEALEAEKRQNIQDKFNAAIEKLQDLIGNLVAGPVGKFLDIITSLLSNTILLSSIMGGALVAGAMKLVKVLRSGAITAIIEGAWQSLGGLPVIGPVLAGAAIAGGIAMLNSKTADDMVQPGYGKRTILSPEGSIALNDNDTIVAGTNLGGGGKSETISPTIDLTPLISAISQVKTSVDRLYAKDTSINMDGRKVGSTLTQGTYKSA